MPATLRIVAVSEELSLGPAWPRVVGRESPYRLRFGLVCLRVSGWLRRVSVSGNPSGSQILLGDTQALEVRTEQRVYRVHIEHSWDADSDFIPLPQIV